MSEEVIILLAGAPMGKQARATRGGVSYTPTATKNYMASLRILAQQAMSGRPPIEVPVLLWIAAWLPIPRSWSRKKQALALAGGIMPNVKPDWDNIGKMCDAFTQIVWRDDKQVYDAHVTKRYSDRPRMEITVRPWRWTAA